MQMSAVEYALAVLIAFQYSIRDALALLQALLDPLRHDLAFNTLLEMLLKLVFKVGRRRIVRELSILY